MEDAIIEEVLLKISSRDERGGSLESTDLISELSL